MNRLPETTQTNLDLLQYYVLPSANPPKHLVEIHNAIFKLWHSVWTQTFRELGLDPSVLHDEFLRQDFITSICHGDQPVTVHLYSFFAIDCLAARQHKYLDGNYPEAYFERLRALDVRHVMSMEYMTVHPGWRRAR